MILNKCEQNHRALTNENIDNNYFLKLTPDCAEKYANTV